MPDKILVVDDEKEIADLVALYLENENYQVFKYYNGMDALRCIEQEDLDLAILDIMLPDISGLTLCRKIVKNIPRFRPVLNLEKPVRSPEGNTTFPLSCSLQKGKKRIRSPD